jgi:hypothetical protein
VKKDEELEDGERRGQGEREWRSGNWRMESEEGRGGGRKCGLEGIGGWRVKKGEVEEGSVG